MWRLLFHRRPAAEPDSGKGRNGRADELHALLESSPDGVALLEDGRVGWSNRAFRQLFALDPAGTRKPVELLDLVAESDRDRLARWLEKRASGSPEPDALEFEAVRASGIRIPVEATAAVIATGAGGGLALYLRDLSARRRREERARHLSRLESLADLAAGVAREFDALFRQIRRLARDPEQAVPVGDVRGLSPVEAIERLASRGAALARRVRALAPGALSEAPLAPVELVRLVREVAADFLRGMPSGQSLRVTTEGPTQLPVLGDPAQLRQALRQLLDNARDAGLTGEIQLRTRLVAFDEPGSSLRPGSRPGTYAAVEVRDEGDGMDERTRARAFEPFFTTKGSRHSGLGLPIVFGVARRHGGLVELDSFPGRGTLARLLVPLSDGVPATAHHEVGTDPRAAWRGIETVLVVDSDPNVRERIRHMLEPYGYHVEVAHGAREMLGRLRRRPAIELVLLGDAHGGPDSGDLLARIRRLWPGQRVLLLATEDEPEPAGRARDGGALGVLVVGHEHADAMAHVVRSALDGPPPTS